MEQSPRSPGPTASDCVFCGILAGALPASVVHRDERCTAFLDLRPINPGHLLVIPNSHAAYLGELDADDAAHLMRVGQALAAALRRSGQRCEGVNLFLADGVAAGQEVFHVHLHVVPRYAGDGFGLRFPPGYGAPAPRRALDEAAAGIRAAAG